MVCTRCGSLCPLYFSINCASYKLHIFLGCPPLHARVRLRLGRPEMDPPAPRRLLSFEASQVSLSRLGKALYPGSSPRLSRRTGLSECDKNLSTEAAIGSPIYGLAANQDSKIAGIVTKEKLQLFSVNDSQVEELESQRVSNKYLPTAIQWGSHQLNNVLALANSGGELQTYILDPSDGLKREKFFRPNLARSINTLSFPSVPGNHHIIGGLTDGSIRLWDLRSNRTNAVMNFSRNGDIVREVQYRPDSDFKFAAIYDSGIVQQWDMRQRQSCEVRLNAHQQGLTLNWHPHQNYLATGGRDRFVHVWNMGQPDVRTPNFTVNTPSPVAKVRWVDGGTQVPSSKIATSGRGSASVNIWSLKRSYVPEKYLDVHSDQVTDFSSLNNVIWSVSRSGKFVQTDLRYEPSVLSSFAPSLVKWTPWDLVAVGFPGVGAHQISSAPHRSSSVHPHPTPRMFSTSSTPSDTPEPSVGSHYATPQETPPIEQLQHMWSLGGKQTGSHHHRASTAGLQDTPQQMPMLRSAMLEIPMVMDDLKSYRYCSENYIWDRRNGSYADACRHNAQVASDVRRFRVAQVWLALSVTLDEMQNSFLATLSEEELPFAQKWLTRNEACPEEIEAQYWDFCRQRQEPWNFLPMHRNSLEHAIHTGLPQTATALLSIFRDFPEVKDMNSQDLIQGTAELLRREHSWVPVANLRRATYGWAEPVYEADTAEISPDTVCNRCGESLSDNAAFLTKNDTKYYFWYCSHCRHVLDGCALCNRGIRGLAVTVLQCGHRLHRTCWREWVDDSKMEECPAGCGQKL